MIQDKIDYYIDSLNNKQKIDLLDEYLNCITFDICFIRRHLKISEPISQEDEDYFNEKMKNILIQCI